MANEGIMAAPMPMQRQQKLPQGYVSSLDAYDAASSAMQEIDPQAFSAYKAAINQKLGALNLKFSAIESFIALLEYMMQYPDQYKEIIRAGIEKGAMEEGDFPAEFDQGYISTMLAALNEQRIQQVQNVSPEAMGPGPQEPMAMKNGGLADVARALQSRGRHGDTILAHINPQEAEMLRRAGGLGTINPYTGLREYNWVEDRWNDVTGVVKDVGNTLKSIANSPIGRIALTIGLTLYLGPLAANYGIGLSAAGTGAIVGGGMAAVSGGSVQDILKGAALGYLGGTISPYISEYMPGVAGSVMNQGFTGAALGTGFGLAGGMSLSDALKTGAVSGLTGAAVGYGQQAGYLPNYPRGPDPSPEKFVSLMDDAAARLSTVDLAPVGSLDLPSTSPVKLGNSTGTPITGGPDAYKPLNQIDTRPSSTSLNQINTTRSFTTPPGLKVAFTPGGVPATLTITPPPSANQINTEPRLPDSLGGSTDATAPLDPKIPPWTIYDNQPPPVDRFSAEHSGFGGGNQANKAGSEMTTASENWGNPAPVENRSRYSPGAIVERAIDPVKDIYDKYLDPERPAIQEARAAARVKANQAVKNYVTDMKENGVQPSAADAARVYTEALEANSPGWVRKYGPMAGAALGATYLAGGFKKSPADDKPIYDPQYTGSDYIRDHPEEFSGGLSSYVPGGDPYGGTYYETGSGSLSSYVPGDDPYGGTYYETGSGVGQGATSLKPWDTPSMQRKPRRYYSPFIGTEGPVMAKEGGLIEAVQGVTKSIEKALRSGAVAGFNYPTPAIPVSLSGGAVAGATAPTPAVPDTPKPYNPYHETLYGVGQGAPSPGVVVPTVGTNVYVPIGSSPYEDRPYEARPIAPPTYEGRPIAPPTYEGRHYADRTGNPRAETIAPPTYEGRHYGGGLYNPYDSYRRTHIGTRRPVRAALGGDILSDSFEDLVSFAKPAMKASKYPRKIGPISGPGTGKSDDIPAMLSDGEFVFTARAVRNAGGGSRRKGAARMYKLMKSLEKGGLVKG